MSSKVMLGAVVAAALLVGGEASAKEPEAKIPARYAAYDALLKRYVDAKGLVAYSKLKKRDEATLDRVLSGFSKDVPQVGRWSKTEQKAFWINVYNAVVLKAMLELHPVKNILEVTRKGEKYNVFKEYFFTSTRHGRIRLSLDNIEHMILRKMGDPRIHSAIVCASKGCPPLRNEAYLPAKLDAQLEDNSRVWFTSEVRGIKDRGDTVYISSVFDWFKQDFGPDMKSRLKWIARYVKDPGLARRLRSGRVRVRFIDWDWSANAQ